MAETFGKTIKGGTEQSLTGNAIFMCLYTSGSAGPLASTSLYVKEWAAGGKKIWEYPD